MYFILIVSFACGLKIHHFCTDGANKKYYGENIGSKDRKF